MTLCFNSSQAVDNQLELFPGQGKVTVKLPFEYAHVTEGERKDIVIVPEFFYTVLSDDKSNIKALVGPLQPCLFIGIRNEENGRTVVFHKQYSNSMDSLIEIVKKELEIKDPQKLTGRIFTNIAPFYDKLVQGSTGQFFSYKSLHHGRSQFNEVKYVKDELVKKLEIKNRTQIKAELYTSNLNDEELGDYEFAELNVLVNSKLEMHSICSMNEKIFGDFTKLALFERRGMWKDKREKHLYELVKTKFKKELTDSFFDTYEVHFEKL